MNDLLKPYLGTLISYNILRRLVGMIGVALPVVLGLGGLLFGHPLRPSISAYYYTELGNWFIGSMCAFGVFLIAYRLGRLDNWLATAAGVLAIVVGLVPTASDDATERPWTAYLHLGSAAVLFVLLAILSFLFAKDRPGYTPARWRRRAHRICGVLIAISVIGSAVVIATTGKDVRTDSFGVFLWESLGVLAFGVSWFMTGRPILPPGSLPPAIAARLPIIAIDPEPAAG